jgi:hypothetical protein
MTYRPRVKLKEEGDKVRSVITCRYHHVLSRRHITEDQIRGTYMAIPKCMPQILPDSALKIFTTVLITLSLNACSIHVEFNLFYSKPSSDFSRKIIGSFTHTHTLLSVNMKKWHSAARFFFQKFILFLKLFYPHADSPHYRPMLNLAEYLFSEDMDPKPERMRQ